MRRSRAHISDVTTAGNLFLISWSDFISFPNSTRNSSWVISSSLFVSVFASPPHPPRLHPRAQQLTGHAQPRPPVRGRYEDPCEWRHGIVVCPPIPRR